MSATYATAAPCKGERAKIKQLSHFKIQNALLTSR
jgi:hypothetical protein